MKLEWHFKVFWYPLQIMVTLTLLCLCWYFIFWPCYFLHLSNSAANFFFFSGKISFSSAKLNNSSAISPQQNQFSISCFRWNTYFLVPKDFAFLQFYFLSCMCYLFDYYSCSSTFWTNYFQIWFFFVGKYLFWSCIFDKYCFIS